MTTPTLLAFLFQGVVATPPPTPLMDRTIRVGAAKHAWFTIPPIEKPAVLQCAFAVTSGSTVRTILFDAEQAMRYSQGKSNTPLQATAFVGNGEWRFVLDRPGEYRLAIDNSMDGRGPADVQVKVTLAALDLGPVRVLSPAKRTATVVVSLLFLAGALGYAGIKLKPALQQRQEPPRPGRFV